MPLLKTLWKLTVRSFELFCLFIIAYLIIGEWLGKQVVNADFEPDPAGIKIYIISNGVHTDIAVPSKTDQIDWTTFLDPSTFEPPPEIEHPAYIAFGWGDRSLFEDVPTWGDLTAPILIRSMLLPSTSAMHISYYDFGLNETNNSIAVNISAEQYEILIQAFKSSFDLDTEGNPQSLNCCFYSHLSDQFYASPTKYHMLFTCNSWTNKLLKEAGIPTARWAPRQESIMAHLRSRNLTE